MGEYKYKINNMILFLAIIHTIITIICTLLSLYNCKKYNEKLTPYEAIVLCINIIFGTYFWSQVI